MLHFYDRQQNTITKKKYQSESLLLSYSFMTWDNNSVFIESAVKKTKKTGYYIHLKDSHTHTKKKGVCRGNSNQYVDSIHLFRLTLANGVLFSSDFIAAKKKHFYFSLMAHEWKRQSTLFMNKKDKFRSLIWTRGAETCYVGSHIPFTPSGEGGGQCWPCCLCWVKNIISPGCRNL